MSSYLRLIWMPIARRPRVFALAAALLQAVGAAAAPGPPEISANLFPGGLNPAAVSAFADAEIPPLMDRGRIPGAVFVVVDDGRVICERAYGVADLKTGRPVSVDTTLFRAASISKIFTAASVLQLVQAHRLDLHRNVNGYLRRFRVASAFGEPVTLADLLTHSSGFDDCDFGYAARSESDRLSLRDYLAEYQPVRVRPPGLLSVYDNYGFSLAGYVVQTVSGVSFSEYVQDHILGPLHMAHSSFSPDTALCQSLATGYRLEGGVPRPCRRNYVNIVPAAGLCTTASDMAGFLTALLSNHPPNGSPPFSAGVLQGLETQQFASAAGVPGRCYGFNHVSIADRSALRQTGEWPGFNSVLAVFPNKHCGMFLAYNLCDYLHLERRVSRAFAEHFIPPSPLVAATTAGSPPSGFSFQPLLGSYLSMRAPQTAPCWQFPREIEVTQSPDGTLVIDGQPYREIGPLLFEKTATNQFGGGLSGRRVAFLTGPGKTRLITQSGAYRRVTWMASARGRRLLMSALTLIFVSVVVLWPMIFLVRLIVSGRMGSQAGTSRHPAAISLAAKVTALAAGVLALWFELSFALAESHLRPFADLYGLPAPLEHLLRVLPVLLVLTAALAGFAVFAWRRRIGHPAYRLHYTLLTVALALFLYTFYSQHLLFAG